MWGDVMDIAQTILLGILASNALFTFIQFLITRRDKRIAEEKEQAQQKELEERLKPIREALLALCSERLESLLRKWMRGEVHTVARWASINNLFRAYESLGGNGEIKALYDIAREIKATE